MSSQDNTAEQTVNKPHFLSLEQRIKLVCFYVECGYNAEAAARRFNSTFSGVRTVSSRNARMLAKKFLNTGSVLDAIKSGRPRSSTDDFSALTVIREAEGGTNLSIRKIAESCNTSATSVYRILKERKLRRYRDLQVQNLKSDDPNKRMTFCSWFLNKMDAFSVIFTDEAVFYLHGKVAKHWVWARSNPRRFLATKTQSSAKLMVWAGIYGTKIIGPFFFHGNVTGKRYSLDLQEIHSSSFVQETTGGASPAGAGSQWCNQQRMVAARWCNPALCHYRAELSDGKVRNSMDWSRRACRMATKVT